MNSNYRTAATLCSLGTWFFQVRKCIYFHLCYNDDDDDDDDDKNNSFCRCFGRLDQSFLDVICRSTLFENGALLV